MGQFKMASKGGMSKVAKGAVVSFIVTTVFIVIAFSSNSWLETDGTLDNPKFIQLGLWNFCLQDFKDVKHLYDRVFNGCRHVLDEEYHIIDWLLRPPFFIAVQTFFTFTFMLIIIAFIGTSMYMVCFTLEHQVRLLRVLAVDGTFGCYLSAVLYYVEAKVQAKKQMATTSQT